MNVQEETSIRALQKYRREELIKIVQEYNRKVREVDDRIAEIREERGTKIKEDWSNHHEAGRSPRYDNLGRRLY